MLKDFIKTARKNAGLSQKELAELINTTPQNISQYERGLRIPRPDTLKRIAHALNVSTSAIYVESLIDDLDNSFKVIESKESNLLNSFRQLSEPGQNKVIDYTDLLLSSGKYNRDPE